MRSSICSCTVLRPGKRPAAWLAILPIAILWLAVSAPAATELSLSEAIAHAEEHSFAVKSALQDSSAAALTYESSRAGRFPVLSLSANSFYINKLQSIELPFLTKEIGSKENYQTDVMLTFPLYTGGRLSNQVAIENQNRQAVNQSLEARKLEVAYRCREAYFNVMAAQATLEAANSSLERIQVIARDVRNLHENGMADSIDILETDLAMQKGQQQVILQKAARANALASLARLIGIDPSEEIKLTEVVEQPVSPDSAGLPTELERPELKQYDHAIAAAEKAAAIERGAVLPSLSSYAGYSYGMPNKDTFNKSWNGNFIFGVKLNWEFNLGRKTFKDIEAARSRAASVRMAQKNLEDALMTQRDVAMNNLDHSFQTCQITGKEFDIAGRQYQLARLRQEAGQISINRLLEMEADLTAAEQQYRASIVMYYLTENDYYYAVGSGRIFGGLR